MLLRILQAIAIVAGGVFGVIGALALPPGPALAAWVAAGLAVGTTAFVVVSVTGRVRLPCRSDLRVDDLPAPPPAAEPPSVSIVSVLSTTQLCQTWYRSYWLLVDLSAGPEREHVVDLRRDLLDELEARDPAGFSRWLASGARAGGDPTRYLTTASPPQSSERRC